jgi:hypothetical protein
MQIARCEYFRCVNEALLTGAKLALVVQLALLAGEELVQGFVELQQYRGVKMAAGPVDG